MPSVRIYQKKQLRLDHLSFHQSQMYKLGAVGVTAVKTRVGASLGPSDSPAKPLTKRYAITKTRHGKGNRRNLSFTGGMLQNFQVRTVSENRAKASLSTRKDRIKAWITNRIEPWMVFSPKDKRQVLEATQRALIEIKQRLLVERFLGGRQR